MKQNVLLTSRIVLLATVDGIPQHTKCRVLFPSPAYFQLIDYYYNSCRDFLSCVAICMHWVLENWSWQWDFWVFRCKIEFFERVGNKLFTNLCCHTPLTNLKYLTIYKDIEKWELSLCLCLTLLDVQLFYTHFSKILNITLPSGKSNVTWNI